MEPAADFEARIAAEQERHDRIYAQQTAAQTNLVLKPNAERVANDLRAALLHALDQLGDLQGTRVLEIGAGTAWDSVLLLRRGAYVVATDVSPVGIDAANQRFIANGFEGQAEARVMAAEQIDYLDASFDRVFGRAVLHHLDMTRAPAELARVLKPGGRAVFIEPLSENPLLDFIRDYVPYPQKKSPKGHRGITYAMIEEAATHFAHTAKQEFYITAMLNRAFGHNVAITPLEAFDRLLVRYVPPARRFGRYVVVTFEKARDD